MTMIQVRRSHLNSSDIKDKSSRRAQPGIQFLIKLKETPSA